MIGSDMPDTDGVIHPGITTINLIVLKASKNKLRTIRQEAQETEGVIIADFSTSAQSFHNDYEGVFICNFQDEQR